MALYIEQMKGLSPLQKLSSGYSYVADEQGNTVRSVRNVTRDQMLTIHVTDGLIKARVTAREEADRPWQE